MKLKKVLTVLFTTMMLLTFSSSASAATGIGDTKESAITIVDGTNYNLFLSDSLDKDWFKWTNNTGEFKFVAAYLVSGSQVAHYRLGMKIEYSPTRTSDLVYAQSTGPGSFQAIDNILIPPGASVYYVVDSVAYSLMQYTFSFRLSNYQ
ncbi:hypothetical protein D1872_253470 [compost metagenome]